MATIMGTGWLASRFHNISTFLIVAVVLPPVIGSALIYSVTNQGVRLFAYYCLQTGPGAIPLALGLISSNYKGVTKKMTITAILFVSYCAGNIAGPQTFLTSESTIGYPTAFKSIMSCYALVVLVAMCLRAYLIFENKSRDKKEGAAEVPNTDVKRELTAEDYDDITDFKTHGFRYRY